MKVFKITGDGLYSSGVMIVAASNIEEATALANKEADVAWEIKYDCKESFGPPEWESKELTELTYSGNKPKVITKYEIGE